MGPQLQNGLPSPASLKTTHPDQEAFWKPSSPGQLHYSDAAKVWGRRNQRQPKQDMDGTYVGKNIRLHGPRSLPSILPDPRLMTRCTRAATTSRAGRVQAPTVSGCQGTDSRNYMPSRTEYTPWPQGCFGSWSRHGGGVGSMKKATRWRISVSSPRMGGVCSPRASTTHVCCLGRSSVVLSAACRVDCGRVGLVRLEAVVTFPWAGASTLSCYMCSNPVLSHTAPSYTLHRLGTSDYLNG